jgi:putative inorganic carbon (HCO3(-)) transporter
VKQGRGRRDAWADYAVLLALALAAPYFLFPSPGKIWIFFVVPLMWGLRAFLKGRFLERTLLDLPILLLLIQVFVSCLVVSDISRSLSKVAGVLFGVAFFFVMIAMLQNEKLIFPSVVAYVGGGSVFAVLGLLGMFTFQVKYLGILARIKDGLPHINFKLPGAEEGFHPNAVGGTLLLIAPLVLVLIFRRFFENKKNTEVVKKTGINLWAVFLSIFLLFVILMTQSRGTWIALILSSVIMAVLTSSTIKRKIIAGLLGAISFAVFGFAYILLLGPRKPSLGIPELIGSFSDRGQVWMIGIKTIIKNPLTGIGMNQIRFLPEVGYEKSHVHNHLINIGAELGLPGLIAYLGILFGIAIMVYEIVRKCENPTLKMVALSLGWGQLAHFIFGISDSIPLGAKTSIFFWFSAALIAAIYNIVRRVEG